jgi:hypothetical protein
MSRTHVAFNPMFEFRRTGVIAAAMLAISVGMFAQPVKAEDLVVRYDQSQLLRMPRNVSDVIIGNPSIADVAIQGGNLLVVTGKTFGITNIIVLDADRNVIQDQRVVVERDDRKVVYLNRSGLRQSFSCTPQCSPTLVIGDQTEYFQQVYNAASNKTKFADSGNESGGGNQGGGQ